MRPYPNPARSMEWAPDLAEAVETFLDDLALEGRLATARSYRYRLRFLVETKEPPNIGGSDPDHALINLDGGGVAHGDLPVNRADALHVGRLSASEAVPVKPALTTVDSRHCRAILREYALSHAPSSLNSFHGSLCAFWTYCVKQGWIAQSPMKGIPSPRVPRKPHRYLTTDQLRHVYQVAGVRRRGQSDADVATLQLMLRLLMQGLRAAELCSLRWEDVDWEGYVTVRGKGDKLRVVPVDDVALEMLGERVAAWASDCLDGQAHATKERSPVIWEVPRSPTYAVASADGALISGTKTAASIPHGPIFPITTRTLNSKIKLLGRAAKIPLTPHVFRHSWASNAVLAGENLTVIQSVGGWADPTLLRHYSRSVMQKSAAKAMRKGDVLG